MANLKSYSTIVCPNGEVFRWRSKNGRFKVLLTDKQQATIDTHNKKMIAKGDSWQAVEYDDYCNELGFTTICCLIENLT